mgnify:CR=1 FL=1
MRGREREWEWEIKPVKFFFFKVDFPEFQRPSFFFFLTYIVWRKKNFSFPCKIWQPYQISNFDCMILDDKRKTADGLKTSLTQKKNLPR